MKQLFILFLGTIMMFSCSKEELPTEKPEVLATKSFAPIDKKIQYEDNSKNYSAHAVSGVDELLRGAENATFLLTAQGDFKISITIDAKNLKNNNTIDIKSDWETKESVQMNFQGEEFSTRDMTIDPTLMGSITIYEYNGKTIRGSFTSMMRTRKGKMKEFRNIQFSSEVVKY
jgi:hypothetical protein